MPESMEDREAQIETVAALKEPVRRALYLHVVGSPDDVSRDRAAEAVGIRRALAAFHLDKLVDEGLLEATYRRLSGRGGPGAGRPSKLYRRSDREVRVTLPQREYKLAADLFARALAGGVDRSPAERLHQSAYQVGESIGAQSRVRAGARAGRVARLRRLQALLREYGFEPYQRTQEVSLRNCPFDGLAREYPQLVCGMNLSLMQGVVAGAQVAGLEACLEPDDGRCCVTLRAAAIGDESPLLSS